MNPLTPTAFLAFVSVIASNPLGAENDICSTAGKLCGAVPCVPHQDRNYFTCQCGKDQYFNATSQQCYHTKSCAQYPCPVGTCEDNDGKAEKTCRCLNLENLLENCQPENAFKTACGNSGGELESTERGVTCRCPDNMKWNRNKCESIACTNKHETCSNLCWNKRLLEDKRCCQGWESTSCTAFHEEDTYCKPGTVSIGQHLDCTNVCAAKQSECEFECTYTDVQSPDYTCTCPPGQELNADQRTCSERRSCNSDEETLCSKMGKQCVFEERKAECRCSGDKIDVDDACTANCTAEKIKECTSMMSTCKIADNAQSCACEEPLTWDNAKKVCVLEKQYRYAFTFKQLQYGTQDRCSDWRRRDLAVAIDNAMKNLYGEDLSASRLIECGEELKVELTFKTEPLSPSLNRIHQCENKEDNSCLFAPHLRIIDGSVTGPTPVDLCTEFFTKIPAVSANNLKCRKREDGGYSLRCAQGKSKASEMYGALTVELCDEDSNPGNGAASVSAAFLLGVLIPVTIAQREL